jgi:membrane protein DedA with SNARE-associated domain
MTVAVSRFVPFANGGVNGLAGMCRLAPIPFAAADIVGNTALAAGYLFLGVEFGRAWGDVERLATIGAAIALLLGGFAVAGILALRREGTAEAGPGL